MTEVIFLILPLLLFVLRPRLCFLLQRRVLSGTVLYRHPSNVCGRGSDAHDEWFHGLPYYLGATHLHNGTTWLRSRLVSSDGHLPYTYSSRPLAGHEEEGQQVKPTKATTQPLGKHRLAPCRGHSNPLSGWVWLVVDRLTRRPMNVRTMSTGRPSSHGMAVSGAGAHGICVFLAWKRSTSGPKTALQHRTNKE